MIQFNYVLKIIKDYYSIKYNDMFRFLYSNYFIIKLFSIIVLEKRDISIIIYIINDLLW